MHPCPGNQVAIGCAVVYYARAAHTFSAGIKWWHCISAHPIINAKEEVPHPFYQLGVTPESVIHTLRLTTKGGGGGGGGL